MGFQHFFYMNPLGTTRELALWWNDKTEVNILSFYKNFINVEFVLESFNKKLYSTFIYGNLKERDKIKVH